MPDDDGNETGRVLMWIGIALLIVLVLGFPFGFFSDWGGDWGFFEGFFMMMFMFPILVIVLIVVIVVAVSNNSNRRRETTPESVPSGTRNPETLAILERRYASGELDRSEYLRMRRDLGGSN